MALAKAINQYGDRASQPAAAAENDGCFYRVDDEGNVLEHSDGSDWIPVNFGTGVVLSADPASPVDGQWWMVATGTTPTRTVAIKFREGGVTYTFHSITM